ncbi:hypothetical protein L596_007015 [Steinernema carpocapsae]|uniref:SET domain-containing protein n=1 Tax=Steinernema carpocapsae TaxID=34508 RepID=A0A4U5P8C4_STECR|nr:hypothetical protein L596_007015 [Steinernema carpocapsae]
MGEDRGEPGAGATAFTPQPFAPSPFAAAPPTLDSWRSASANGPPNNGAAAVPPKSASMAALTTTTPNPPPTKASLPPKSATLSVMEVGLPPGTAVSGSSSSDWDWAGMNDKSISTILCVYHALDRPLLHQDPNNRATTSLPLNLSIRPSATNTKKMGIWTTDFIPRGSRFGPLIGEPRTPHPNEATVSPAEAVVPSGCGGAADDSAHCLLGAGGDGVAASNGPSSVGSQSLKRSALNANEWKVFSSSGGRLIRLIDTADDRKSNWMKYVQPATSMEAQNLVACQIENDIYFYSIKAIKPSTELLFWFSREYAQRLQYPLTCSQWDNAAYPTTEASVPSPLDSSRNCVDEALDFSLKKTSTREEAPSPSSPMLSDDSSSSGSSATSPPPPTTVSSQTSSSLEPPPPHRPNVIQNPLHRPVPTKQQITVPCPDPYNQPGIRLHSIFDYWRTMAVGNLPTLSLPPQATHPPGSTGGLWVQPTMPQIAATPGTTIAPRPNVYGRPGTEPMPQFAATAAPSFVPGASPYATQLYGSRREGCRIRDFDGRGAEIPEHSDLAVPEVDGQAGDHRGHPDQLHQGGRGENPLSVWALQQNLRSTVKPQSSPTNAHGRTTFQMYRLPQGIHATRASPETSPCAYRRETAPMSRVPEAVQQHEQPENTPPPPQRPETVPLRSLRLQIHAIRPSEAPQTPPHQRAALFLHDVREEVHQSFRSPNPLEDHRLQTSGKRPSGHRGDDH